MPDTVFEGLNCICCDQLACSLGVGRIQWLKLIHFRLFNASNLIWTDDLTGISSNPIVASLCKVIKQYFYSTYSRMDQIEIPL